jgi:hypothetical protein
MSNGVISQAIQRQADRPDIHKPFERPKGSVGYGEDVFCMVRDLKTHVPALSHRQLSTLVGIATCQIRKALATSVAEERWTSDDNEASAAAELDALTAEHGTRSYEDHPDARFESKVPIYFSAPVTDAAPRRTLNRDSGRRSISLPTHPIVPLRDRYAGVAA